VLQSKDVARSWSTASSSCGRSTKRTSTPSTSCHVTSVSIYGSAGSTQTAGRILRRCHGRALRRPSGISGWVRVQAPGWRDHPSSLSPRMVRTLIQWALAPKEHVVFKVLPPGFSTHLITAAPWNGGIPTFSATPGQEQTYEGRTIKCDTLSRQCS